MTHLKLFGLLAFLLASLLAGWLAFLLACTKSREPAALDFQPNGPVTHEQNY